MPTLRLLSGRLYLNGSMPRRRETSRRRKGKASASGDSVEKRKKRFLRSEKRGSLRRYARSGLLGGCLTDEAVLTIEAVCSSSSGPDGTDRYRPETRQSKQCDDQRADTASSFVPCVRIPFGRLKSGTFFSLRPLGVVSVGATPLSCSTNGHECRLRQGSRLTVSSCAVPRF
ncbi:hypothetical protein J2777_002435 [Paraburkholderia graminis]|nr:hypothetical protein [Paraburkholderia graminis]